MGNFWDNATKEFGKKTGKAIGNKLYGKHADDVRKRVAFSGSSNVTVTQPSIDYDAIERAKQTTLECENNLKLLKTGLAVLNAVNAEHPMLPYFVDKEQEWQAYAEKQRKRDIILYSTLAGLLVAFIIFVVIMANV